MLAAIDMCRCWLQYRRHRSTIGSLRVVQLEVSDGIVFVFLDKHTALVVLVLVMVGSNVFGQGAHGDVPFYIPDWFSRIVPYKDVFSSKFTTFDLPSFFDLVVQYFVDVSEAHALVRLSSKN